MGFGAMIRVVVGLGMILGSVAIGGKWVKGRQHVVRGWNAFSEAGSWSAATTFRVGDRIRFLHYVLQGKIVELKSKEEYESCDVSNPIRMYTDVLESVSLEEKGIRYFVSSNSKSCKNGSKLHVEVLPQQRSDPPKVIASKGYHSTIAAGPIPSDATQFCANSVFLMAAFLLFYIF